MLRSEFSARRGRSGWQSGSSLLEAVVSTSGALVCVVDAQGLVRLYNPACERTLGWRADEVLGRPYHEFFRRADAHEPGFDHLAASSLPVRVSGEYLARDGSVRSIMWSASWVRRADGTVEYCLGTGLDVTGQRSAEEQLRYLSNFDAVTGLPNEQMLRVRVRQFEAQAAAGGQLMGFLLLKAPRLQVIRASLGLDAAQAVLLQVAERLAQWARAGAAVARAGERKFAIVAVRGSASELSALARQVLAVMNQPFAYRQQELHVDPCIGIAVFPNDGDQYDAIVQAAEAAVQRALASRGERIAFYRPEFNRGVQERFHFETALRRAVERDQLVLHYQPQASLATGAIVGVEVLVRWQHPELGLILPGRFIGLAEETGMILAIGEWVLRRACEQGRAWQKAGLGPVPVSVNLSARQFAEGVAATVGRILAETGLEPHLLELELTESASMEDPQKTFETLRQLKDMGVRLAIDDFGSGYSNLNYLKRFPVDKIKLDQSFVRDIISDPDDLSISRAVIAMAHGLRLSVIAEGVETAGQLALLAQNGCDEIQGYYFSRPVDAQACERLLRERTSLRLDGLESAAAPGAAAQ